MRNEDPNSSNFSSIKEPSLPIAKVKFVDEAEDGIMAIDFSGPDLGKMLFA